MQYPRIYVRRYRSGYFLSTVFFAVLTQARNVLATMLDAEPARRGTMDAVLSRAFFAGGASVTAAKIQA